MKTKSCWQILPNLDVYKWQWKSLYSFAAWNLITSSRQSPSEFALIRIWSLVLFGTVISPQKTDETRQSQSFSSSSPVLLYNNNNFSLNTFYRPNANFGTTSLYINRKQQKTTIAPTVRKNGKQKGNKNKTSTTPRPTYTTYTTLNQFSVSGKSTKNKSKSTSANFSRLTSTVKPSIKSQTNLDGVKVNNNNDLMSLKGDKVQASNKAPKQVKETLKSFTTMSPMSKMFELLCKKCKIQEFYPELKPYKENNNPAYFTSGSGKPSRENSKSHSSSFVSQSSALQKKNSPNDEQQKENHKNEKGEKLNCLFFFGSLTFLLNLIYLWLILLLLKRAVEVKSCSKQSYAFFQNITIKNSSYFAKDFQDQLPVFNYFLVQYFYVSCSFRLIET